jgi:hypothetical protein
MPALSNWGLTFAFNKSSTPRVGLNIAKIAEIAKNWRLKAWANLCKSFGIMEFEEES